MYLIVYALNDGTIKHSMAQTENGALKLKEMHEKDPEKKFLYFLDDQHKIIEIKPST